MMRQKIDEKRPRPVGFPSDSHPLSPCRGCSSRMRLMGRCRECGLFTAWFGSEWRRLRRLFGRTRE